MLGARRRQANGMDTTPTKHTAALYTMASLSQNDTPVYMLSELQCALLLHHLAIVWQSQGNIPTTADNVAHALVNVWMCVCVCVCVCVHVCALKCHRGAHRHLSQR